MKKWLLFLTAAALFAPLSVQAVITVQSQQMCAAASGVAFSCVLSTNPSASGLLVLMEQTNGGSPAFTGSVTGSGSGCSGTITNQLASTGSSPGARIDTTPTGAGGACTLSWGSAAADRQIWVVELAGSDVTASPVDGTPALFTSGDTSPFQSSYTTSTDGSILLAAFGANGTPPGTVITLSGSSLSSTTSRVDTPFIIQGQYQVITTAASTTDGWGTVNKTVGGGRTYNLEQIAIKPAAVPGSIVNITPIYLGF